MIEKVLLTGALGFIGANFTRYVVHERQRGYQWATIDIKSISDKNHYAGNRDINQYRVDITDINAVDNIFYIEHPDVVIHLAAATSSLDQVLLTNTNVLGTKALVDTAIKYQAKRFIYVSSDGVYGSLNDNDTPWNEKENTDPQNPYTVSKLAGEKVVENSSLRYNIIRISNNYGERQPVEKLIPQTIKCILDGNKVPIYGQGNQIRDWIYVQDACRGILSVLKRGANNAIYNLGANSEMSNVEMVGKICKILGRGYDLMEHLPDPKNETNDFRHSMDCSKIRELGWAPEFKLGDGLEQTVRWYEKNKFWALK